MLSLESGDDAGGLVRQLEELSSEELALEPLDARFGRLEVLERLLERAESVLAADPSRAERLGLIAIVLAGEIEDGDAWVPPGLARACTVVGSARRLLGRRKDSEASFERASAFLAGSAEEAAYCRELALLRWEQGRTSEATALLQLAALRFAEAARGEEEVECLGLLGILAMQADRPAQALGPLLRAHSSLGSCCRAELVLTVRLELALCHAKLGEASAARASLEGVRPWLSVPCSVWCNPDLQIRWVEGLVAFHLGKWDEADSRLSAVQRAWIEEGALGEATLATLDRMRLAAERGSFEAITSSVDALASGFRGVSELPISLQALCAFEEEALAPGGDLASSARAAARFVRQTLRSVGLRVEPPPFP